MTDTDNVLLEAFETLTTNTHTALDHARLLQTRCAGIDERFRYSLLEITEALEIIAVAVQATAQEFRQTVEQGNAPKND